MEKTYQGIACRCRAVPPRILEPQENRDTFGTSKIPKKTARQERRKTSTWRKYQKPPRRLVDQEEENIIITHGNWLWEKICQQLWWLLQKAPDKEIRKGNSLEWSGALKVSPRVQGVWNTPRKTQTTQTGRCHPRHREGEKVWEEKPPHQPTPRRDALTSAR